MLRTKIITGTYCSASLLFVKEFFKKSLRFYSDMNNMIIKFFVKTKYFWKNRRENVCINIMFSSNLFLLASHKKWIAVKCWRLQILVNKVGY